MRHVVAEIVKFQWSEAMIRIIAFFIGNVLSRAKPHDIRLRDPHYSRNTKNTAAHMQSAAHRKPNFKGCFIYIIANGTKTDSVITS